MNHPGFGERSRVTTVGRALTALLLVFVAACSGDDPSNVAPDGTGSTSEPGRIVAEALDRHVPDTDGRFVAAALVVRVDDGTEVVWGASDGTARSLGDVQRPSGSTLKLLVDVALAHAGVHPDDGVIVGRGCTFPDGVMAPADETTPIMTISQATDVSSNCAFGKLARAVGEDRLRGAVTELGITRPLDVGTRFGFGDNTISMTELATAGVGLMQSLDGDADEASAAARAVSMASGVLVTGTARGNALEDRWAAAKTGTAGGSTDAWIVGATTDFVTVVWMGNPVQPDDGMTGGVVPGYDSVHGGDLPALIWNDVMTALHRDRPPPPPLEVALDRDIVIVVDPSVDCLATPETVRVGSPGPEVPHIATGGPVQC